MNKYFVHVNKSETLISLNYDGSFRAQSNSNYKIKKVDKSRFIINGGAEQIECIVVLRNSDETILLIDGNYYTVKVKTEIENLADELLEKSEHSSGSFNIISPMPGMVSKINVKIGDEVKEDESLFELEAMKMKNIVRSTGKGKVVEIRIKEGKSVEKGQIIIVIEA